MASVQVEYDLVLFERLLVAMAEPSERAPLTPLRMGAFPLTPRHPLALTGYTGAGAERGLSSARLALRLWPGEPGPQRSINLCGKASKRRRYTGLSEIALEVRMVTSRDVAKAAGVSQTTVSRVLSGSTLVSTATRQRVDRALIETGYAPSAAARAMRTHRIGTIGVVVSAITNPFYANLIGILSKCLTLRGLRMTVWDGESPGEESAVTAIREGLVDGLIFATATRGSIALNEALARHAPLVLFNRVVEDFSCDQVSSDNRRSGENVARFLIARGHRRIGYVAGSKDASTSEERLAGMTAVFDRASPGELELMVHEGEFSYAHGRTALVEWFGEGKSAKVPTAVFCANDMIAVGFLDEARRLAIEIPDNVSVVGHDDIDMASWNLLDLTTVRQPVEDMVEAACDLLLARIQDPTLPPRHLRFDSEIVERGTTARRI